MMYRTRLTGVDSRPACGATATPLISFVVIAAFLIIANAVTQESAARPVAIETLTRLAEQGNSVAQNNLGLRYAQGDGVQQDNAEALKWCRRAAEQGLPEAQNNIGLMYAEGLGARRNDFEAVRWYRLSALQAFAIAQNNLGWMYDQGRGVERNYEEAARWYRRAAEQELPNAQFNLAAMYEDGFGVDQDLSEAIRWYRKAADQQHEQAVARVQLLAPGLSATVEAPVEVTTETLNLSDTTELPAVSKPPEEATPPVETALANVAAPPRPEVATVNLEAKAEAISEAKPAGVATEGAGTASVAASLPETSAASPITSLPAAAYRTQLAAYRSEAGALDGWRAMIAAYPSQFEGRNPSIVRIDLGGKKGVFFRLMTGHFGSAERAKVFCTRIVRSGAASGCIPRPMP
jgi:TPR repeat protein